MSKLIEGKMLKMEIDGITYISVDDLVKTESSSNVAEIAYQEVTNKAFILFKNGGLYEYDKVDKEAFDLLKGAESVGRHLRAVFLKNGYSYEKLENTVLSDNFSKFNLDGEGNAKDS